jgi:deoxyribodipyrimidine photo-lyase
MQSSHRVEDNWALNYAIETANNMDLPLIVYFGLTPEFPGANLRHYWFMLEGLKEASAALQTLGIKFIIRQVDLPAEGLLELCGEARLIIVDRGYLRINREWYSYAAEKAPVPLIQVEDNVIVPLEEASKKEEYSAATLRPKLLAKLNDYLELPPKLSPKKPSIDMEPAKSVPTVDIEKIVAKLKIDKSINKSLQFHGGTTKAKKLLELFTERNLQVYEKEGSRPDNSCTSNLSPYLHFGQISPVFIARKF